MTWLKPSVVTLCPFVQLAELLLYISANIISILKKLPLINLSYETNMLISTKENGKLYKGKPWKYENQI